MCLGRPQIGSGNFLDRGVLQPLVKGLLPRLWKLPNAANYLSGVALFSGVAATIAAGLSYSVTSLSLLLAGSVALFIRRALQAFSADHSRWKWITHLFDLLVAATVMLLLIGLDKPLLLIPNMVIYGLLIVHLLISRSESTKSRLSLIKPDLRLILIILLVASIVGQLPLGLYGAALLTGTFLLLDKLLPANFRENPPVSAE